MGKWMGLFMRKNHLLRCWGWNFFLNLIGAVTLSLLLKLPSRKLEPWFGLWRFFLLIFLFIRPCTEYCSHVWVGSPSCYLELLDNLQKKQDCLYFPCHLSWTLSSFFRCSQLKPSVGKGSGTSWTSSSVHLNWLNWFHFLFLEEDLLVILIGCRTFFNHPCTLQGCLCQQFLSLCS